MVNDQGGKSPRNSKSNSVLLMKDVGATQDSSSFAALQSSEADLLDSLPERSGNTDVNLLVGPEPSSILGDESADPECLPLPDKEVEPLGESPLDIETARLEGGSRILGPSSCEPPLSKVANLVEVPPSPSSTSVFVAPRSSRMARWVLVESPSHPVNLPHAQGQQAAKHRIHCSRQERGNQELSTSTQAEQQQQQHKVPHPQNPPSHRQLQNFQHGMSS
ncbi:hypothetical protein Nepgr_003994 [Nepenthes gracilis]|uniref:Uncharacterized protein n=1 Tax=Nepenthes gracilis TaxID=150966 RepID=A0AAD3S0I5_NEPGR|nr:hypothetical protein Nepgr_003994 [Nepenthes gracilis]